MDFGGFVVAVVAILATLILLPWIVFHYITKWKKNSALTDEDEQLLQDLYEHARKIDDRLDVVERLATADNPDWRPAGRLGAPSDRVERLGSLERDSDRWRGHGQPDYVVAVTEKPEDGGTVLDSSPESEDTSDERTYREAVQLVVENQRASTSWLQRQLRVGYNSAGRLIERMEDEGVVARADHLGRREVLVSTRRT